MTNRTTFTRASATGNLQSLVTNYNANLDALEVELENSLSRKDNILPNSMEDELDMNGNDIINVNEIGVSALTINGTPVQPFAGVTVASAFQSYTFTATLGQTSFSVAPYTAYVASVQVEVNGLSLPPSDISVSGTNVIIPACTAGDEVVIRRYTSAPSPFPSADDITFLQGGTGVSSRTVQSKLRDVINVKDFGAVGDGVADDTAAIQNAVDYAMYGSGIDGGDVASLAISGIPGGMVLIPAGVYKTSDTIHLGYGEFKSCVITGEGMMYRGEKYFDGTSIKPTFNDRPVFSVQCGRNTSIRNLSIRGKNFEWIQSNNLGVYTPQTLDGTVASNWVDPTFPAASSSRYAPYCAIAIDPYSGTRPATSYPDRTFPSWLTNQTQYQSVGSGSVNTTIIDVEMSGFVVAVAIQPSDNDANGDNTRMTGCWIESCQYAVSIGQTQSRSVLLENSIVHNVHTVVVTGKHGRQQGKPAFEARGCELAFSTQWVDVPTLHFGGGLKFHNCYGEGLHAIGSVSSGYAGRSVKNPVVFDNCEFLFTNPNFTGVPTSIFSSESDTPVKFNSCVFTRDLFPLPSLQHEGTKLYVFDCSSKAMSFTNCHTDAGLHATKKYEKLAIMATGGIVFRNCEAQTQEFSTRTSVNFNLNTWADIGGGRWHGSTMSSNRTTGLCIYTSRAIPINSENDVGMLMNATPVIYDKSAAASISTSGKTVTVDMTGSAVGEWQLRQAGGEVGDIVFDSETKNVFIVSARTGLTLTLVAQTGLNKNDNLITSPTLTGYFYAQNCRRFIFGYTAFGDLVSGSATIDDVRRGDGWQVFVDNADNGVQVGDFWFMGVGTSISSRTPTISAISNISGTGDITIGGGNNLYTQARTTLGAFFRPPPANNT